MNIDYLGTKTTRMERVRFFPRQLITADDLNATMDYFSEKLRRHNRYLHGWGVVCGCEVKEHPTPDRPWQVQVCPGYLITPQGHEIEIPSAVDFDLGGNWHEAYNPCPQPPGCGSPAPRPTVEHPVEVHLAVCYTECSSRPVRVYAAGCDCDETACEHSRVRESFELVRLSKLPDSYQAAVDASQSIRDKIAAWKQAPDDPPFPVMDCPLYSDDDCVVLATITVRTQALTQPDIRDERQICLTPSVLFELALSGKT